MGRRGRGLLRDDRGAIAPLFAVALMGLLAMGAVAWDLGRGYALRAELEAAVDAAALAGATQLDGTPGSISRARSAAQGALVQNAQRLANTQESAVAIANANIIFFESFANRATINEAAANADSLANFIQIDLTNRPFSLVFGALAGMANMNVSAHAVAGYGAAICKVPPLMVCNPDEAGGALSFDGDANIGKGLTLKTAPGNNSWGPGNFGYLSVTGEDGIREAMGRVTPQIQCFGNVAETQPGNINAAQQYFNTRFGFYQGSANGLKNQPDYMPSQNTITGQGNACTPANPVYNACGGANPAQMGLPRDCCAYAGGSCTGPENSALGDGVWEQTKYLEVNHATATLPTDWTSYGPNPSSGSAPTRYQVYQWENSLIAAGTLPAGAFSNNAVDSRGAACYTGGAITPTNPDRRTISAVVVNCLADGPINGQEQVNVVGYIDLLLTEPVETIGLGASAQSAIYGEVIGNTTDTSAVGQETKLYSVRLYE